MTESTVRAMKEYLAQRGPASSLLEEVFVYRHQPLSVRYCQVRLRTYGRRCWVQIAPHQLRHSYGTLLLNAGCRITSIQKFLGHKELSTTMIYARVCDQTVADDYYEAMERVEKCLELLGAHEETSEPVGETE
jgi:site-specific recombinase XerC